MATKLDTFTFAANAGRGTYDWEAWLNGDVWRLTRGEDFKVPISSFRTAAFAAAHSGRA